MIQVFLQVLRSREGATAIEYGLILGLIAVSALVALQGFADSAIAMWEFIRDEVVGAMNS
ncbi:MAG: Flp family type IVb pilin [Pseudomonadota bacterium]